MLTDKIKILTPDIPIISEETVDFKKKNDLNNKLTEYAKKMGSISITLCSKLEQEIAVLTEQEKDIFLKEYKLTEQGLNKLIKSAYNYCL